MSSKKPPKKKVVVSTTKKQASSKKPTKKTVKTDGKQNKNKITPTVSARSRKVVDAAPQEMIFTMQNYLIMGVGIVVIAIGLILMSGGSMPSPDVWDESIIYGFRRTVLAPILILGGLAIEIYGIFKK